MSNTLAKYDGRKLLVGVMGRIASGKSTVANHIATMYQGHYIRFSDTLRTIAEEKHIEPTQKNLQRLWQALRETCGGDDDFLARLTCSKLSHEIDRKPNNLVVAEGIRMVHDVTELNHFCDAHGYTAIYLFIKTSVSKRVERYNSRIAERGEAPIDPFTFVNTIDKHECEGEIEGLRKYQTYEITNNHDVSELFDEIGRIMSVYQYSRPALF